jgi:DNA replication and repair protein RecF
MISSLKLNSFRNFENKSLEFSPDITVIVGHNAIGKTNILEALFLLSTGRSFKARHESEMLAYGQELARVSAAICHMPYGVGYENHTPYSLEHIANLEVVITSGSNGWPKKRLLVNGVPRRAIDFAGNFKTVLFGPWDMDLVTESPSIRRKFLDTVLSQTDREYRRCLLSYEKGLRQRNKLLWRIREEGVPRSQLLFWNQLLIKNGNYITQKREEFIDFVNNTEEKINTNKPINTNKYQFPMKISYQLEYDPSAISEGRLEQYKNEEVSAATTLVGPHRDDMQFKIYNFEFTNERDLAAYGSRGEQRMGILWLKMAELDYIEKNSKNEGIETSSTRPTLLLDDIFSELDHGHRDTVMELARRQQTIITTADEHFLEGFKISQKINLE